MIAASVVLWGGAIGFLVIAMLGCALAAFARHPELLAPAFGSRTRRCTPAMAAAMEPVVDAFTSGVFLSMAVVHALPEGREALGESVALPVTEMVALASCVVFMWIQQATSKAKGAHRHGHGRSRRSGYTPTLTGGNLSTDTVEVEMVTVQTPRAMLDDEDSSNNSMNMSDSAGDGDGVGVDIPGLTAAGDANNSSESAPVKDDESSLEPLSMHRRDHGEAGTSTRGAAAAAAAEDNGADGTASVALLLFLYISHSMLFGIVFAVQVLAADNPASVGPFLAGALIHKLLGTFGVASKIKLSSQSRLWWMRSLGVYSLLVICTPLGIALSAAAGSSMVGADAAVNADGSVPPNWLEGMSNALVAGVMLYMSIFHGIPDPHRSKPNVFVSFTVGVLIATVFSAILPA